MDTKKSASPVRDRELKHVAGGAINGEATYYNCPKDDATIVIVTTAKFTRYGVSNTTREWICTLCGTKYEPNAPELVYHKPVKGGNVGTGW